jgi:hypothetical protein
MKSVSRGKSGKEITILDEMLQQNCSYKRVGGCLLRGCRRQSRDGAGRHPSQSPLIRIINEVNNQAFGSTLRQELYDEALASSQNESVTRMLAWQRGSSVEAFPVFGHSLDDYDSLFRENLDLLLTLRENEYVSWTGKHRAPLTGQGV